MQSSQREDIVRTIKQAASTNQNRVRVVSRTLRVAVPPKFIGDELSAAKAYFDDRGYKYINEYEVIMIY